MFVFGNNPAGNKAFRPWWIYILSPSFFGVFFIFLFTFGSETFLRFYVSWRQFFFSVLTRLSYFYFSFRLLFQSIHSWTRIESCTSSQLSNCCWGVSISRSISSPHSSSFLQFASSFTYPILFNRFSIYSVFLSLSYRLCPARQFAQNPSWKVEFHVDGISILKIGIKFWLRRLGNSHDCIVGP